MKVNVFHVEGALPYVLSAHETTTIHFSEKITPKKAKNSRMMLLF